MLFVGFVCLTYVAKVEKFFKRKGKIQINKGKKQVNRDEEQLI